MLRLSPKEIDLIEAAIRAFGSVAQKIRWSEWVRDNPVPPQGRESPPLPPELAQTVLAALRSHNKAIVTRMRSGRHDEDETADMGNDLLVTESVASDLSRELGLGIHPR